ncbi:MAG: hypothetical protein U0798_20135 [Gemmataceae bacterium]
MTRLLSFVLTVLFFAILPMAQSADPPTTLDELVKEYERFDLPFPPPGTKFVIIEAGYDDEYPEEDGINHIRRWFGLLAKPKSKSNSETSIYYGVGTTPEPIFYRIREVPAEPESIQRTKKELLHLDIITAIQCQKLGHKRLAAEIYRRWKLEWKEPPSEHLWAEADSYWTYQILNPKCERKTIIEQFKKLQQVYPSDENAEFIRSLELADAPRTQKNDPIEKLIDDLVDATNSINEVEAQRFHECPPIRKLIACGFDAVPALISHLDDKRMTRCAFPPGYVNPFAGISFPGVTVSKLCEHILEEMAVKPFPRVELTAKEKADLKNLPQFPLGNVAFGREKPLQREPINAWLKQARAKGEKEYFLSQLFTKEIRANHGDNEHVQLVNPTILVMLDSRFPGELKDIYCNALTSPKRIDTKPLVEAIVNSSYDRNMKRELLELGLKQKDLQYRMQAEAALAILDNAEYSKRLIAFIDRMPLPDGDPEIVRELKIMDCMKRTRDPAVWAALEKAIRRSPNWLRFQLLSDLNVFAFQGDQSRRERIRILTAFLDDDAVQTPEDIKKGNPNGYSSAHDRFELRNFVAHQLAPYFAEYIEFDEHRSGDEWACLRKWLRDEAEKELK